MILTVVKKACNLQCQKNEVQECGSTLSFFNFKVLQVMNLNIFRKIEKKMDALIKC